MDNWYVNILVSHSKPVFARRVKVAVDLLKQYLIGLALHGRIFTAYLIAALGGSSVQIDVRAGLNIHFVVKRLE